VPLQKRRATAPKTRPISRVLGIAGRRSLTAAVAAATATPRIAASNRAGPRPAVGLAKCQLSHTGPR
jgi:hypothetical protein